MKITNIIGFVLILLADIVLFLNAMNMPAGSKVASAFLIFAAAILIIVIVHLIVGIKENKKISIVTSTLLIVVPIISFLTSGRGHQADIMEYGKYYDSDTAFKMYTITVIISIIFGIVGLVLSIMKKKKD